MDDPINRRQRSMASTENTEYCGKILYLIINQVCLKYTNEWTALQGPQRQHAFHDHRHHNTQQPVFFFGSKRRQTPTTPDAHQQQHSSSSTASAAAAAVSAAAGAEVVMVWPSKMNYATAARPGSIKTASFDFLDTNTGDSNSSRNTTAAASQQQ